MADISLTISVVSHGQIELVNQLIADLATYCAPRLTVILTHNVPEDAPDIPRNWHHKLEFVCNERPKGFGANHNAAFRRCVTKLFCVVNPDIRLTSDPFPVLTAALDSASIAVVGPLVRGPKGDHEDSARTFPTAASLLCKVAAAPSGPEYPVDGGAVKVDWVAGMFMAIRAEAFKSIGGFDERFFLYYEDVDLCRRLSAAGFSIVYEPRASIIHDARRASRRNPRLMAIHAASALRYLLRRYD